MPASRARCSPGWRRRSRSAARRSTGSTRRHPNCSGSPATRSTGRTRRERRASVRAWSASAPPMPRRCCSTRRRRTGCGSRRASARRPPARFLGLWPVAVGDRVLAVLELATVEPWSPRRQSLVESLLPVLALNLEILERHRRVRAQQRELQDTEAWYRGIVGSAPDGLLVADQAGRIVLVNAQLERMFGYGPGELEGLPIEALVPAALREGHVALRDGFLLGDGSTRAMAESNRELHGQRQDGSLFPVEVGLSRLPAAGGRGSCTCASVRDATLRRRQEDRSEERRVGDG